jgi:5-bromo-4-chloroindolyl phosphate hydrolysis protein
MVMELLKETSAMIFGIFILGLILKLFFKHTLIGKIVAVTVADIWLFTKWSFRITRNTGRLTYKTGKVIYKYLNNKLQDKKDKVKKQEKKVVNGSNVIDFQSAKQLRHKWNK